MPSTIWVRALKYSALGTVVVLAGCAYVPGLYGSKPVAQRTVVQPRIYAPQRHYVADISAARAYVGTQLPIAQRMHLIDVRDATEYRLGHPEGARHLPYPRIYRACQPHPSGAPEAQIRSDDGGVCRYGTVAGSEVRMEAADFWQSVQEVLPYKDAPVAVLCRTGACAADVANMLARPDIGVHPSLTGQGYTAVYAIKEGFVGEPMVATDAKTGRVLTVDKNTQKFNAAGAATGLYSATPVAFDANHDGRVDQADWGGWRNFLGLPYVVSMPANLLHEAALPYYEQP